MCSVCIVNLFSVFAHIYWFSATGFLSPVERYKYLDWYRSSLDLCIYLSILYIVNPLIVTPGFKVTGLLAKKEGRAVFRGGGVSASPIGGRSPLIG